MKLAKEKNCYFCGNPATSREHVPPKCIFPETKDFPGSNFRKNLITVPSCDEHNLKKSEDDEFLMGCLTPVVGNNAIAFLQTHRKIKRAWTRKEKLFEATMKNAKRKTIKSKDGTKFPVFIGKPDGPRLIKALEAVARGLYYFERNKIFVGKCKVLPTFLKYNSDYWDFIKVVLKSLMDKESKDWHTGGYNPEIFKYLLGAPDQYGLTPMSMVFYEGAEVIVSFQPEGLVLPREPWMEELKIIRERLTNNK